jgi:hypothetical protein
MVYGAPVIVTPEDGSFYPRMQEVEKAVSSYTKAIIINSPNNPSGVMYPESFVAEIVDYCERKGVYLIMDDIYHKLIFDGKTPISAYKFTQKDNEATKVITINGISKLYGMTGFRVGWVVAPKQLVEIMTNVQGQILLLPAGFSGLQQQLRGALQIPAEESAGGHRARKRIWDGGASAAELRHYRERHHRRRGSHQMGIGSHLTKRNLHRRTQTHTGLAMNNLLDIKTPAQNEAQALKSDFGLENHGLSNLRMAYWNLPVEALYEEIAFRREARITQRGPLVAYTGKHTARSANDKFIVREATTEDKIW